MRFKWITSIFIGLILISLILGISLVWPLVIGTVLFFYDGLSLGYSFSELSKMFFKGIKDIKTLLIIFTVLGFLTATWRASGTVAYLVYYGIQFINPKFFILSCFLLTKGMSLLLGSLTATITTMGVVLISIARAGNINLLITTGAILSGSLFGDRISPVSSSANLVAGLTKTDQVDNRRIMLKSTIVPTIITIIIFGIISITQGSSRIDINILEEFSKYIKISHINLLPALVIIIMSFFKANTLSMVTVSTIFAIGVGIFFQGFSLGEIFSAMIFGFNMENVSPSIEKIINGGGLSSTITMILIVGISAGYFGIFEKTEFLKPATGLMEKLEEKIGYYFTFIIGTLALSIIFCNQTMPVLVLNGIYKDKVPNKLLMLDLEDMPILMASLIPWNMAAFVAFAVYEVSWWAVFFNFYCIIMPIYYYFYRKKILKNYSKKDLTSL